MQTSRVWHALLAVSALVVATPGHAIYSFSYATADCTVCDPVTQESNIGARVQASVSGEQRLTGVQVINAVDVPTFVYYDAQSYADLSTGKLGVATSYYHDRYTNRYTGYASAAATMGDSFRHLDANGHSYWDNDNNAAAAQVLSINLHGFVYVGDTPNGGAREASLSLFNTGYVYLNIYSTNSLGGRYANDGTPYTVLDEHAWQYGYQMSGDDGFISEKIALETGELVKLPYDGRYGTDFAQNNVDGYYEFSIPITVTGYWQDFDWSLQFVSNSGSVQSDWERSGYASAYMMDTLTVQYDVLSSEQPVVASASGLFPNTVAMPVPEPDTWALLLAGLGVVGVGFKRRLS